MPPYTTSKSLSPKLVWYNYKIKKKFTGRCLKQEDKAAFTPKKVVNFSIAFELDSWPQNLATDFTLGGFLFGSVTLTKNADPGKYLHSGYGIGFDMHIKYSLSDGSVGKNVIFGADLSSSVHIDNKGKGILIFGKAPTQELNNTTLTAETLYSINFI